ncbi:MAG: FxLYD domain-containing protein [Candidatus Omnitrophica bacterium]|nr:FxLYD domain-containing protein [Candidatus Omnitrophota bacterium]
MPNLEFHNVTIGKVKNADQIAVKGEISNFSDKAYNTVAVRIILFVNNTIIANTVFTVNGVPNGSTKAFERTIDELVYSQIGKDITRYEIYTESCY